MTVLRQRTASPRSAPPMPLSTLPLHCSTILCLCVNSALHIVTFAEPIHSGPCSAPASINAALPTRIITLPSNAFAIQFTAVALRCRLCAAFAFLYSDTPLRCHAVPLPFFASPSYASPMLLIAVHRLCNTLLSHRRRLPYRALPSLLIAFPRRCLTMLFLCGTMQTVAKQSKAIAQYFSAILSVASAIRLI